MNAWMWTALGAALYGIGMLFVLAICKAGASEDEARSREHHERVVCDLDSGQETDV